MLMLLLLFYFLLVRKNVYFGVLKWNNENRNIYWFIEFFVDTHNHIRYWKWKREWEWEMSSTIQYGNASRISIQRLLFHKIEQNVWECVHVWVLRLLCVCVFACAYLFLRRPTDWMSPSRYDEYEIEKYRVILKSNSSALLFLFMELLKRCKLAYGEVMVGVSRSVHYNIGFVLRIPNLDCVDKLAWEELFAVNRPPNGYTISDFLQSYSVPADRLRRLP